MIIEVFAVRAEAREREKLGQSVHVAMTIVVFIMCVVGIVGALAVESPSANILTHFAGERFIAAVSFGLLLMITLLFPLINFPMAVALDSLFSPRGAGPNFGRRRLISFLGLVAIIGMDTLVPDVDSVFSLAGSLGLGLMAFTLPPAAFLAIKDARRGRFVVVALAILLLLAGVALTGGSTSFTIYDIATRNTTATNSSSAVSNNTIV